MSETLAPPDTRTREQLGDAFRRATDDMDAENAVAYHAGVGALVVSGAEGGSALRLAMRCIGAKLTGREFLAVVAQ